MILPFSIFESFSGNCWKWCKISRVLTILTGEHRKNLKNLLLEYAGEGKLHIWSRKACCKIMKCNIPFWNRWGYSFQKMALDAASRGENQCHSLKFLRIAPKNDVKTYLWFARQMQVYCSVLSNVHSKSATRYSPHEERKIIPSVWS